MHFRVALAQINVTVGDLAGNAEKIRQALDQAQAAEADLVAFPEMALSGYPPEDLLLKPQFIADCWAWLERLLPTVRSTVAVIGFPHRQDDLYNAAAIIAEGRLVDIYHKQYLPTYGVFDEDRYFQIGRTTPVYVIRGVPVGVSICEDIWHPGPPLADQARSGALVAININGSPYHAGKRQFREQMVGTRASDYGLYICYVNLVGGQDELVFDGGSFVVDPRGQVIARARQFAEDLLIVDLDLEVAISQRLHDPRLRRERLVGGPAVTHVLSTEPPPSRPRLAPPLAEPAPPGSPAEIYQALVLGTGDYTRKNGFREVIVGLSGGIDSSLTATIAVDALGPAAVVGLTMPSRFTRPEGLEDVRALASNLGIRLLEISIEPAFQTYLELLAPYFAGTPFGVAEENIQARLRGNLLMAFSNKFGYLVLSTGNKSELATGYCTLYGDMVGGFAVLKDVVKTMVYRLARYRNERDGRPVIPERVLQREPSAELRPGQRDVDTLPPYDLLDPILKLYVEEDRSYEAIVEMGFPPAVVQRVIEMVDRSEYKRRQAPPGVKITPRAFGRDRRLPITNRYRPFPLVEG